MRARWSFPEVLLVLLAVGFAPGCDAPKAQHYTFRNRGDSVTFSIENLEGLPRVELSPLSRPLVGQPGAEISSLRDLSLLGDDAVVVADETATLFLASLTGETSSTGGYGQGPGEYGDILWVQKTMRGVAVFDPSAGRISELSADLQVHGVRQVQRQIESDTHGVFVPLGTLPEGDIYLGLPGVRAPGEDLGMSEVFLVSESGESELLVTTAISRCSGTIAERCAADPDAGSGEVAASGDAAMAFDPFRGHLRVFSPSMVAAGRVPQREGNTGAGSFIDQTRRVWLSYPGQRWLVVDVTGGSAFLLKTSDDLKVVDASSGVVAVVRTDSLGVQTVHLAGLTSH